MFYVLVRRAARRYGLREAMENDEWTVYWSDCSVSLERVMHMKQYQKINHFPGMSEICRKDLLARNMNRMAKLFPKEYNIFPKTWCLPADYGDFQAYIRVKKHKTYICKPDSGCQGRGIFVTKSTKDIKAGEDMICQVYISKPFLIDEFKFDLRIYVLVTSCDPLRVFMYNEGLARFATMKYSDPSHNNVDDACMHLTNYAINKHSENFIRDEDQGSKRKLSTFNNYMEATGYDTKTMWESIQDVIIKVLIAAHPVLKHNYSTCFPNHVTGSACFEILGFDILLDRKLKPWILEVNHSPSFTTDSKLDREVKDSLLYDTLVLINLGACDRKKFMEEEKRRAKERLLHQTKSRDARNEDHKNSQAAWLEQADKYEEENMGGYIKIFPKDNVEKYEKYFNHSRSLCQETAASKAREECARQQIQGLRLKQEQKEAVLKGKRPDLQGESAGEKVRRFRVKQNAENSPNSFLSLRLPPHQPSPPVASPQTDEPTSYTEAEEAERLHGLLQREQLIRDLGVIDRVYDLLEGTVNSRKDQRLSEEQHHQESNSPTILHDRSVLKATKDFANTFNNHSNSSLQVHHPISETLTLGSSPLYKPLSGIIELAIQNSSSFGWQEYSLSKYTTEGPQVGVGTLNARPCTVQRLGHMSNCERNRVELDSNVKLLIRSESIGKNKPPSFEETLSSQSKLQRNAYTSWNPRMFSGRNGRKILNALSDKHQGIKASGGQSFSSPLSAQIQASKVKAVPDLYVISSPAPIVNRPGMNNPPKSSIQRATNIELDRVGRLPTR
ncbi:tubulin polyglutamylase TTLL6 [Protopterus annectens]|uniref:tubulin polyglutamylase TTLL6 n=1 Tax=Protopterus annectens TaxID=7888 RepID=UPI001CF9DD07|nr:tubulin polyglutamylase TTLL6 [Protopterus annectens]